MEKGGPPPPGFQVPPPPYNNVYQNQGPQPHQMPSAPPNVIIVQGATFGPEPMNMTCPNCGASISTSVRSESTTKTHLFALLLCLIGCWPCAPCPYFINSCQARHHYCPSCNTFLGQYE